MALPALSSASVRDGVFESMAFGRRQNNGRLPGDRHEHFEVNHVPPTASALHRDNRPSPRSARQKTHGTPATPAHVALAYTPDSAWRNRAEFLRGREEIVAFLTRKWNRELDYRLIKQLWTFGGNRIAIRFAYEYHDDNGQWYRAYGNENWEFETDGLMRRRLASINEHPIGKQIRRFPLAARSASGESSRISTVSASDDAQSKLSKERQAAGLRVRGVHFRKRLPTGSKDRIRSHPHGRAGKSSVKRGKCVSEKKHSSLPAAGGRLGLRSKLSAPPLVEQKIPLKGVATLKRVNRAGRL